MRILKKQAIPLSTACGDPALACPECGFYCSHIQSVVTAAGFDPTEGGKPYDGTELRGTTPFRRDCLVITVRGECDHVWEIRIQQDKGVNFITAVIP